MSIPPKAPPKFTAPPAGKPAGGGRPPFWRRQYILNKRFQYTFVGWFAFVYAASQMMLFTGMYKVLERFGEGFAGSNLAENQLLAAFVGEQKETLIKLFFGLSLWLGLVMIAVGILLSHRVAGPLFRLKLHLEQLARSGELKPLKFREGDYFQEIPKAFNEFLATVEKKPGGAQPPVRAVGGGGGDEGGMPIS